ncbi:MAG TPA: signal peptidase II, partial [Candidatus Egerieicola faecale]|nr:signal peptidase II [Candidatus Egerieicola faecale]
MKNLSLLTRKILALCGALVLAFLDQLFKYLVVIFISPMNLPQVEVIPGVLSLTYVDNPGIAWSMFMDHPEILTILTAVLMLVLLVLFFTKFVRSGVLMVFLMLVLGGGLGNLADRVFRGSVVDYLTLEFIDFPVFN